MNSSLPPDTLASVETSDTFLRLRKKNSGGSPSSRSTKPTKKPGKLSLSTLQRTKAIKERDRKREEKILQKRDQYLKDKYGLTLDQYHAILERQKGYCGMPGCGQDFNGGYRKYVDHDHQTGRVRGILCYRCNHRLLGRGLEIPRLHAGAVAYLTSDFDGRKI